MSDIDVKKMNSDELKELGCQIREEWDERIPEESQRPMPWLDIRLGESSMNHLRNAINDSSSPPPPPQSPTVSQETYGFNVKTYGNTDARKGLAGNISKSKFIEDKDNWFYKNALKEPLEYLYYRDSWINYYNVHIAKVCLPPVFELKSLWVNFQKQYEFNPPHNHSAWFSFVVFMKIPTHWKEQHALPMNVDSNAPCASDFGFLLGQGQEVQDISIPLSPEDEGRMLLFPAWLVHQVFPFYGTEEERITISGNIELAGADTRSFKKEDVEQMIEEKERELESMKIIYNKGL